jgi:hydroxyacylglutathione hydrolase
MLNDLERDLGGQVALLRQFLTRMAEGGKVTADMIREGVTWRDIDPPDAQPMIENEKPVLLDVRTPEEVALGYIPDAVLIPMDEIEHRLDEVPRPGDRPLLVYCEGGVRSAAICDYLAKQGWEDLCNLSGGIASWKGPLAQPK